MLRRYDFVDNLHKQYDLTRTPSQSWFTLAKNLIASVNTLPDGAAE